MKLTLTYELIIDTVSHNVTPLGNIAFSFTREADTRVYSKTLKNPLTFRGADYALIKAFFDLDEQCSPIIFRINNERLGGVSVGDFSSDFSDDFSIDTEVIIGGIVYEGLFYESDCEIDEDLCTITVSPRSTDSVTCYDEKKGLNVNFFNTDTYTVNSFFGTYEETLEIVFDENPDLYLVLPPDPENWCPEHVSVEVIPSVAPLYEHRTTWYRVKATGTTTTPPTASGDWTQIGTTDQWFKCPNLNLLNQPRARKLSDVLHEIGDNLGCTFLIASHFFNVNTDDLPPLSVSNAAYDYAAQYLNNLMIVQKSDVKRPTSSNPATLTAFNVTLETLLQDLSIMFNTTHRLIDGTVLQIEHKSYFEAFDTYDISTNVMRYKFTHDQLENVKNEQYEWADKDGYSAEFGAFPIAYYCSSATQTKQYRLTYFSNDVAFIQDTSVADRVADSGFVLLSTEIVSGQHYLINSNLPLSWQNLHANLHTWAKVHKYATINNTDVTMNSVEGVKKQQIAPYCLANSDFFGNLVFDPTKTVTTTKGVAVIESAEYDYINERITLEIRY